MQLTPEVRLDANATLSENKIADFEEIVYDYAEGFDYVNVVNHRNTDIAMSPNAVAMGMLTWEDAASNSSMSGVSVSLIGKHVGRRYPRQHRGQGAFP